MTAAESDKNLKINIFNIECLMLVFFKLGSIILEMIFKINQRLIIIDLIVMIAALLLHIIACKTKKIDECGKVAYIIGNSAIIMASFSMSEHSVFLLYVSMMVGIIFAVLTFKDENRKKTLLIESIIYTLIILSSIKYLSLEKDFISLVILNSLICTTICLAVCYAKIIKKYQMQLEILKLKNIDLNKISITDPLTGLGNRNLMNDYFDSLNKNEPINLIIFDIDHFKLVNDTYGHLAGDKILKKLAVLITKNQEKDFVAIRYGGEEFICIVTNKTLEETYFIAETIRKRAEKSLKIKEIPNPVTISGGVADYESGTSIQKLILKADKNLYEAKETGRNKIVK